MFTLATFQLIRSHCLTEFENLLGKLEIAIPDWNGDELRIYDKLDAELTEKICGLMKSPTIIDGYMNILDLGGIAYSYSELDNELLGKVIDNKEKILDAVRLSNAEYDSWQEKWGNASPAPKKIEVLNIEADLAKPFNNAGITSTSILQDAWTTIKDYLRSSDKRKTNNYHVAYQDIEGYVNNKREPHTLLELDGQNIPVNIKDIVDLIQKIAEQKPYGEEKILCLKIKKSISCRCEEIPPAPPKSDFTIDEAEDAFDVLTQWNEILSLAR